MKDESFSFGGKRGSLGIANNGKRRIDRISERSFLLAKYLWTKLI